jgi:hypothetical protein
MENSIKNQKIVTFLLSDSTNLSQEKANSIIDYYDKIAELIERTHIAMGKSKQLKIMSTTTKNAQLNLNVFATTH